MVSISNKRGKKRKVQKQTKKFANSSKLCHDIAIVVDEYKNLVKRYCQ